MLPIDHDRRRAPRLDRHRPCKVLDCRTRRYLPGTTCNVSQTGALVRIHRAIEPEIGQRVYLAIPARRHDVVIESETMIEAEIVRALPSNSGETLVAIEFREAIGDPSFRIAA